METMPDEFTRIHKFLETQALFDGIKEPNMAAIARTSRFKRIAKGTFLFFQTDEADCVYVVRRGAFTIQLENPEGRELIINEMNPGDCFGELGILTGEPRSTSVVAILDSEVLVIPKGAFLAVVEDEPTLTYRLLDITARRLQESSRREEALAFYDAQERLGSLLLALDEVAAEKGYISLSQEELAQRAGLTRQTVATILGRWRRRGWLLTGRGNIVLLNRREIYLLVNK